MCWLDVVAKKRHYNLTTKIIMFTFFTHSNNRRLCQLLSEWTILFVNRDLNDVRRAQIYVWLHWAISIFISQESKRKIECFLTAALWFASADWQHFWCHLFLWNEDRSSWLISAAFLLSSFCLFFLQWKKKNTIQINKKSQSQTEDKGNTCLFWFILVLGMTKK